MNFDWINIKIGFRKLYTAYKKNIFDCCIMIFIKICSEIALTPLEQ